MATKYVDKYRAMPVQARASFWFLICAFLFFTAFFISYLRYSFSVFFTPAKIEEEA
mgnify:CR=1 FL=1